MIYQAVLRAIDRELWVAEQPLRFYGVPVGTRMSVVRLGSGDLVLHSPIQPTPELRAAVEALGPVRHLVAPNRWHYLFVTAWQKLAPEAQTWVARGLPRKRPDLPHTGVLGQVTPLSPDLEQHVIDGAPLLGEVVFYHPSTRTLLCSDFVHNVGHDAPFGQRVFMRLLGGYGGVKTNLLDRMVSRDHAAERRSLERILSWKIDRIIMGHGRIFEGDGNAAIRRAYEWLGSVPTPRRGGAPGS